MTLHCWARPVATVNPWVYGVIWKWVAYCYQVLVVTGGGLTSTEETPRRNLCCTEFQEEPFSFATQQVGLQAAPFRGAQRRSPGAILDLTHFQGDDFFTQKCRYAPHYSAILATPLKLNPILTIIPQRYSRIPVQVKQLFHVCVFFMTSWHLLANGRSVYDQWCSQSSRILDTIISTDRLGQTSFGVLW